MKRPTKRAKVKTRMSLKGEATAEKAVASRKRGQASFSRPSTYSPSFPFVGVGASVGGLEAFTDLLQHLQADTGLGFVLVQHLDPKQSVDAIQDRFGSNHRTFCRHPR